MSHNAATIKITIKDDNPIVTFGRSENCNAMNGRLIAGLDEFFGDPPDGCNAVPDDAAHTTNRRRESTICRACR